MKIHSAAKITSLAAAFTFVVVPAALSEDAHHAKPTSGHAIPVKSSSLSGAPGHKTAAVTEHGAKANAHDAVKMEKHASKAPAGKADHGGHAAWSYAGNSGPAHWGDLKTNYKTCKTGTTQSPVDFRQPLTAGLPDIKFDYRISELTVLNNGHTVQVNVPAGSSMISGGKKFELLQFHFHTGSEHRVNGRQYPIEMHLVHKSADGQLAVVGVFMEAGRKNIALSEIWRHLPKNKAAPQTIASVAINPRDLLPNDRKYFRYMGSLTTPPCSEGVHWHVMVEPLKISPNQIKTASSIMGDNARPAQPRLNRLVLQGK